MKSKWKKRWADALDSGSYAQGKNCLRTRNNRFCCLGVLCDIVDPDPWNIEENQTSYQYAGENNRNEYGIPTEKVFEITGLRRNQIGRLIRMNDEGEVFSVISRYIKDHISED